MTLISAAFLVLFVFAAASLYLATNRAKLGLRRLAKYELHSQRFFAATRKLLNNAETPDSVVEVLEFLNECIVDEPLARRFFAVYERSIASAEIRTQSLVDPDVQEFLRKRSDLEPLLAEAFLNGVLAITFLSDDWGVSGRALIAEFLTRERRAVKVMVTLKNGKGTVCALPKTLSYA